MSGVIEKDEDLICEICSEEFFKLAKCRECKTKCCSKCIYGTTCVDCMEEDEDSGGRTKPSKYDY